jgi:NDP-sugar pyrophosphorylase family protein
MAGRGSRFLQEGFKLPKPLIPIHGRPMIELVINNLRPRQEHRFIFLCLSEHIKRYNIDARLQVWAPGSVVVEVADVTEGAACTVLLAKKLINSLEPLMIANSDQWIDFSIDDYLACLGTKELDGLIMTMWADDPKWSFVRIDKLNRVCEVVEKKVVSNIATVGIYNFKQGRQFVTAAESMISKGLRVNDEFYVAPVYNEMISGGSAIGCFDVGKEFDGMYGLGIPTDLKLFQESEISREAIHF